MKNLLIQLNAAARCYRMDSRLGNRFVAESEEALEYARRSALEAGWTVTVCDLAESLGGDQINDFVESLED